MRLIFVELSCLQAKIAIFMLKSIPMTSKNSLRSSIFKLNQDTPEMHPWYKFGPNATNICSVIVFTSKSSKGSCWNQPPWPRNISQGHPSSNLTKTLLGYIHGISLVPMRLIFVEFSCLQAIDVMTLTDWSRLSIVEINQDTSEIHPWYKFGPNTTNICWVIMFTSERWKYSCLKPRHSWDTSIV